MAKEGNQPMAAIGEYETVLPFQAVGVKPYVMPEEESGHFESLLLQLAREKYAVIFVQEHLFEKFMSTVETVNEEYAVSVLPIPGLKGSSGAGLKSIRNSVERAVGMDIFAVK
ncbi:MULTISPECIES: V-type ATP synthase subunit F [Aminobacterium]|uniref:V-type ATP synthase subunit F n=1 Tax=Aminobacterium TaxID=81466 RepID=UPI00257E96F6|nr:MULTISPECIES: V-type ATP synthase subunit F [unclassified Aminobacterium]